MPKGKILAVCSDPGGASAILPIICLLQETGYDIETVVSDPASKICRSTDTGLNVRNFNDQAPLDECTAYMKLVAPDLLLSASGTYNMLEHSIRVAGRNCNIVILAVLDYWFGYQSRFERVIDGKTIPSLPDHVLCMDAISCDEIQSALKMSKDQVHVIGWSSIERSIEEYAEFAKEVNFDSNPPEKRIVFFSDAYYVGPNRQYETGPGSAFDDDGNSIFGYTPDVILRYVLSTVKKIFGDDSKEVSFRIKTHPRECPDELLSVMEGFSGCFKELEFCEDTNRHELISWADLVVGMGSVIMFESAMIGKPTASVQIGLKETDEYDPCIANALGVTKAIFDQESLKEMITLFRKSDTLEFLNSSLHKKLKEELVMGAARRGVDVVEDLLLTCSRNNVTL